jgi:hypothetical protein
LDGVYIIRRVNGTTVQDFDATNRVSAGKKDGKIEWHIVGRRDDEK